MMKDKVAIVTGGGSGLGEATCKLFAGMGVKVVVADYNFESAKRVSDEINEMYSYTESFASHVNVADKEQVEGMVMDVLHTYGKIDILVNNAGITRDNRLEKMTMDDWNQVIAVNLTGVFNCSQAVLKHMAERGYGKVINISSIVGRFGNFGQTNYAAAKAGVIGMTQTWCDEYAKKGINVNAIAPGFINTPMTAAMPEKVLDAMAQKVPMKRLGEADEIAKVCLFLASEQSSYINGAVIPVDGGLVI